MRKTGLQAAELSGCPCIPPSLSSDLYSEAINNFSVWGSVSCVVLISISLIFQVRICAMRYLLKLWNGVLIIISSTADVDHVLVSASSTTQIGQMDNSCAIGDNKGPGFQNQQICRRSSCFETDGYCIATNNATGYRLNSSRYFHSIEHSSFNHSIHTTTVFDF